MLIYVLKRKKWIVRKKESYCNGVQSMGPLKIGESPQILHKGRRGVWNGGHKVESTAFEALCLTKADYPAFLKERAAVAQGKLCSDCENTCRQSDS